MIFSERRHQGAIFTLLLTTLMLNGCGKSGGGITDSEDPTPDPEPPAATVDFKEEDTSFLPGEFIELSVANITLDEKSYEVFVDETVEVELIRYDEVDTRTLLFVIPEIGEGEHTIDFSLMDIEQTLTFSIEPYQPIEQPDQYVEDVLNDVRLTMEEQLKQMEDPALRDRFQNQVDELEMALAESEELTENEIGLLARVMKTNLVGETDTSQMKGADPMTPCEEMMKTIAPDLIVLVATLSVYVGSTYLASTISWTGWGAAATAVVGAVSGGMFLIKANDTIDRRERLIDACFEPYDTWIDENLKASMAGFAFEHGVSKSFSVETEYDLPEEVYDLLREMKKIFQRVASFIPDSWIQQTAELDYREVRSGAPTGMSIDSISDERVTGSAGTTDGQLTVTLEYDKDATLDVENELFTVELGLGENAGTTVMEAVLAPPLPVAYPTSMSAGSGNTRFTGTLKADFAAHFTVETPPEHGTVTLDNVFTGEFTYEPDESFDGSDSFTYSAANATGSSDAADVISGSILYGWYSGDYVLDPELSVCGPQMGETSSMHLYIYDNPDTSREQTIMVIKSIMPGIPDIYRKYLQDYDFNHRDDSGYRHFVSNWWGEKNDPETISRSLRMNGRVLDGEGFDFGWGDASYNDENISGPCHRGASYYYRLKWNATYVGFTPPDDKGIDFEIVEELKAMSDDSHVIVVE